MLDFSMLNNAQKEAMLDTEGRVLVLAGAGSGKTRVLTYRIAHIVLDNGIPSQNVLAITFTNKATGEMKDRLQKLLGEDNRVWISTFHSLCTTILRYEAENLDGYAPGFTIYDESDSKRTIAKAVIQAGCDGNAIKEKASWRISDAKNKGLSPQEYYQTIKDDDEDAVDICRIYEIYEKILQTANAMDFDDLLIKTKELFLSRPDILAKYQYRFRYIHVDEFQDTNAIQFDIARMLSEKWGNLFVVGDDDQSIYGWRGAEVGNILHFDKYYPDVKIHKLLQNYRSTPNILAVANNVIKNNKERHEKQLFTERQSGAKVEYYGAYSDRDEADWVVDNIRTLKRLYGYSNRDFAILVRVNSISRTYENKLASLNIKYRMLGGFKFFDRKEIQDVIAYLRLVVNPRDNEAFVRIANFPRRGIGDTTIEKLGEVSYNLGLSYSELCKDNGLSAFVGNTPANKLKDFSNLMDDLRANKNKPLPEFTKYLVDKVGFENAYSESGKEEDITRMENITEFLVQVKEFTTQNGEKSTLEDFLQTVSLAPDNHNEMIDTDIVTIATMHAVKGLEFKVVFIVGCEKDIFPTARAEKNDEIEEERRVMYVAVTRAMDRLYISYCSQRFRFSGLQKMMPSIFVTEAQGGDVKKLSDLKKKYEYGNGYGDRFDRFDRYDRYDDDKDDFTYRPKKPAGRETMAHIPPKPTATINKDISSFKVGDSVIHKTYGEGKIIVITGNGADTTATVVFPKLGIRKFMLAVAPLTKK